MTLIDGSCLCGEVTFAVEDKFDEFHLCHCQQCQKASGTAHVAHLFTQADNFQWLTGAQHVQRYDVPDRAISNAYCGNCGSPVPYLSLASGKLVVPAGALNTASVTMPQDHIFYAEKAAWYETGVKAVKEDGFPS